MLYAHQQKIVTEFPHKSVLVWETGTGKTQAAIELVRKAHVKGLFIVPKGLKENWRLALEATELDYTLMTKEEFRHDAGTLAAYKAIVVDEAHYFLGMHSQMSKSLLTYLKKYRSPYVWLLSATIYSTPWNVYRLSEMVGVPLDYIKFRRQFFSDIRFGSRVVPVVKKGVEAEIADIVRRIGSVVRLDECVDVPEQNFDVEYFSLTSSQKKSMRDVYDVIPIVRFTKYHQICGGTLTNELDKSNYFTMDSLKLERLLEIVEANEKSIIVCRYNNEVDRIFTLLEKFCGPDRWIGAITGETKNKHEVLEEIRKKEHYTLIVNASCSEGWELPECPLMVFYSYSFSLKDYIQMIGRIQRINNIKKNTYLSLIVKGTIDEDVYTTIQRKQDFQIEIYARG